MPSTEAVIGRKMQRLFDGGAVAGLTKEQFLDRVARRGAAAEAAFEAILARHGSAVLACCRRLLGDSAAAEDAFQATFPVRFRRPGSIRAEGSLAPWLLQVARLAARTAALILAVVSLISAGAGLVVRGGRHDDPQRQQEPADDRPSARAGTPAVDRYGDPLPRGAIARLGTTRFRHGGGFFRVSFAPDGKTLVTAREGVRVWDAATGRLLRSLDAGWEVVPSPDRGTLFAAGRGSLRAIDSSAGRELRRVSLDPSSSPERLAISPDGKALAVLMTSQNQMRGQKDVSILVLLDAGTLATRWRIEKDHPYASDLAFSADGRVLAIAGPAEGARTFNMLGPKASTIRLLDVAGGAEVRRIPVEGFGVGSLAFSPDGRTLAAGVGDRTIRLYDPATGQERLPRLGQERAVPPSPEGNGDLKGYGATKERAGNNFPILGGLRNSSVVPLR
jgi:Sigma-70 region 2/WD domain, G-beta repeat